MVFGLVFFTGDDSVKDEIYPTVSASATPAQSYAGTLPTHTDNQSLWNGTILAGSTNASPLIDFNQADYDKAIASDKLVVLYFYANWCPICRAELPHLESSFNQQTAKDIVGFRVNFNDSDTDKNESDLADQYGVPYQHTKVFVKNGDVVLKAPDSWEIARYLTEFNSNR